MKKSYRKLNPSPAKTKHSLAKKSRNKTLSYDDRTCSAQDVLKRQPHGKSVCTRFGSQVHKKRTAYPVSQAPPGSICVSDIDKIPFTAAKANLSSTPSGFGFNLYAKTRDSFFSNFLHFCCSTFFFFGIIICCSLVERQQSSSSGFALLRSDGRSVAPQSPTSSIRNRKLIAFLRFERTKGIGRGECSRVEHICYQSNIDTMPKQNTLYDKTKRILLLRKSRNVTNTRTLSPVAFCFAPVCAKPHHRQPASQPASQTAVTFPSLRRTPSSAGG